MLNVAVIGASGYTGVELLRLLYTHPEAAVTCVTSEQSAGRKIADIFPSLRDRCDLVLEKVDAEAAAEKADLIFTALPHQAAMAVVPTLLRKGKRVVDLSADYRLRDAETYAAWYADHTSPDLLAEAVYGLPEIRRETIAGARLVANPGCYPTSVILGLAPLLQRGLIETDSIISDSKSGVTGAGRSAKVDNLFCEVNDSFKPYGVGGVHRHIPEIEQELSLLAGESITISFTPHLVPMDRGIVSTIYARLVAEAGTAELLALYREFYDGEAFVRILPEGSYPSTAFVRGSNFCDIGLAVDKRTGRVIVTTAIDNLVKGAAGQAIQNMNILADLPENMGLEGLALFP